MNLNRSRGLGVRFVPRVLKQAFHATHELQVPDVVIGGERVLFAGQEELSGLGWWAHWAAVLSWAGSGGPLLGLLLWQYDFCWWPWSCWRVPIRSRNVEVVRNCCCHCRCWCRFDVNTGFCEGFRLSANKKISKYLHFFFSLINSFLDNLHSPPLRSMTNILVPLSYQKLYPLPMIFSFVTVFPLVSQKKWSTLKLYWC